MRAPYKYPYISIFIVSYYLLEHEGYYYKLRSYLGYKEINEIDYVVHMDPEKYQKLSSGPNRTLLLHCFSQFNSESARVFNVAAMKAKERKRSPVIFGDIDCSAYGDLCASLSDVVPSAVLVRNQAPVSAYTGQFNKRKLLKLVKSESGK